MTGVQTCALPIYFNKGLKKTIFTCVRYGNVLESTGSVIPFFESKIKNKEEIPLTDPRMTRFIIYPEQAVELIFNAIKFGVGGEVFIPKLPAFKIVDLIDILKEKHASKVQIKNIGLRPGEKIHELMLNEAEIPLTYSFNDIFIITSVISTYNKTNTAQYCQENLRLNENIMKTYSSESAVISREEVKKLFKDLGLLG